jgi:dipeptidyl aminopeptidase/acylaminoacyl peptidase
MRGVGIVGAILVAFAARCAVAETLVPVETFAKIPAAISARLSPDGTKVALISSYEGSQVLYIHSLVEGGKNSKIIRTGDFQVRWVRWKDDQHLVAGIIKTTDRLFRHMVPTEHAATRLLTFNSDGDDIRMVGEPVNGFALKDENVTGSVAEHKTIHPQIQDEVVSMMPQAPGQILQQVLDKVPYIGSHIAPALYAVDLDSGRHHLVDHGDERIWWYRVDQNSVPRIGEGTSGLDVIVYVRDSASAPWREIHRHNPNGGEIFQPLAFLPDNPRMLYVLSSAGPDGKPGLWRFDTAANRFDQLVDDQAKLEGDILVHEGVLIGYSRKDGSSQYLDPAWQADYQMVSKAVKGRKLAIIDRSADGARTLFEMSEPHHPRVWWLLDRTTKPVSLWPAVEEYPDLTEEQVAPVKEVHYKARDGLDIPAYLTLPIGYKSGPIAFVVLPHGGPYVCEGDDFDYESQFLASRGWGVLRPQYRGTSCFGPEFERKGFHEWGFAMQDDVTDGTHWLIEQKYADPSRICIVGGSYGGYAALMGAVKEPDLYRCAAAWAPVTDLVNLRREIKNGFHADIALDRLGEDDDRLEAASPARHADRVKIPVLLMHGNQDFTVQPDHSHWMEAALNNAGKQVEAVYLDNADHYRQRHDARFAWLSALDRFLAPQLGGQTAAR